MMTDVDVVLDERGKQYGVFAKHAAITQAMKAIARAAPSWDDCDDDMKEAIEMILHKIGRILNGDPKVVDSWVDIAGYSKLVADRLEGVSR